MDEGSGDRQPGKGESVTKRRKIDNREAELRLYLAAGKQLLKTDDLHFGYWTDDLEVELFNLSRAQEKHSELIISHIPEETRTILDVGCGVGKMASRLIHLGYEVDGISPSAFLAEQARQLLGSKFCIFECRFEELHTDKRYDLILFSESFQYVKMERALQNCMALLNDGGHLLICDFFRTDADGESPLKAGPRLSRFYQIISGLCLQPVEDIDITKETAPTMDLADGVLQNIFRPIWELALMRLESSRPLLSRLLRWKYSKKIERLERRYFGGMWDAEHFRKFKSYRLLLYRKTPAPT